MTGRRVHAIRGATTVAADERELIAAATRELLSEIVAANRLRPADIVSALFTVTPDLTSDFPARSARELGWTEVPLMCMTEIAVPGSLARCIRVLVHVEFAGPRSGARHVYLRDARSLRPEWASEIA
jgi:chorismate mutase